MITTVAVEKSLPVYHLDASYMVFFQAPPKGRVLMRVPPGFDELSGNVVRLLKCRYGLKHAGREWRMMLVTLLGEEMGLEHCRAEPCIFRVIVKNEVSLMVGVRG